jgi:DNA-binding transcriptional regulator YdaS (Cro superfamily)
MYRIKEDKIKDIKRYGTVRKIAQKTGLNEGYISQVLKGTRTIKEKVCAYAITKAIDSNYGIENLFEIF